MLVHTTDATTMAQDSPRYRTGKGFFSANFSPAFLYPFKGIWYFASHRYLHPLLRGRLLPLTLLSTCILVLLFISAYLPIVLFLAIFHHKGSAWVNGTFIVLGLGNILIAIIFEALFGMNIPLRCRWLHVRLTVASRPHASGHIRCCACR